MRSLQCFELSTWITIHVETYIPGQNMMKKIFLFKQSWTSTLKHSGITAMSQRTCWIEQGEGSLTTSIILHKIKKI